MLRPLGEITGEPMLRELVGANTHFRSGKSGATCGASSRCQTMTPTATARAPARTLIQTTSDLRR
jgi:hypothetical protein